MRKSILSPRVASSLVKVGHFLSSKTPPPKVTTLSSGLAGILSHTIVGHCHFDEIPNLRLELVVDSRNKYNHDLGDCFACTILF